MSDHTGQVPEMVELKPCWHCKSVSIGADRVRSITLGDRRVHYVECGPCASRGPLKTTEAEAIALWNTRPIEAALRQERDRLRAALREISCHPHTQNLLWWQKKAREALSDE